MEFKRIFLSVMASILLVSCTQDLSKKDPYISAIGKHFALQEDLYLYQFHDSFSDSWPPDPCKLRIGHVTPKDDLFFGLSENIEEKYIGTKNLYVTLKGILWKGSTFTIKRIVEQKSLNDEYCFYLISPEQGPFAGQEIESSDIVEIVTNPPFTKTWSDPPIFKEKYALPLPSDGVWWK